MTDWNQVEATVSIGGSECKFTTIYLKQVFNGHHVFDIGVLCPPLPGENIWYTPFYFRDVWQYRRLAAQMELLFSLPEKQDAQVTSKLKTQDEPAAQSPLPLKETKTGQLTLF